MAANDQQLQHLLERDARGHRPSLENRVAHQHAQPLDTIGQRSGYRRDQTILQWCADALRDSPAPRRHLDVGCAYGNMIFMLHAAVDDVADVEFVGVDLDDEALEYASAFAERVPGYANCSFQPGDVTGGLPFDDGWFSSVSIADVIEHLESPAAVLAELRRVTRPGGIVVVATPQRESLFKSMASGLNRLTRGRLYRQYYAGKDTELDDDGNPVMEVAVGHDHISEMNLDELIEAGTQAGLVSDGVELMPVFSGSAWFDRKPVVLASVLVVEGVHDRFERAPWAHGLSVRFRRPT
jgi:SAM-dependent methyltransferase